MTTIYSLSCPIEKKVKYIGRTTLPLKTRLSLHISQPNSLINYKWTSMLNKKKLKPIIEEIEVVESKKSDDAELFWINTFKSWGFVLNNYGKNNPVDRSRVQKLAHKKKLNLLKKYIK